MILLIDQSKSMFEAANQTVNYSNKHTMAIDMLNYEHWCHIRFNNISDLVINISSHQHLILILRRINTKLISDMDME